MNTYKLYKTLQCAYCPMVERLLKSKNIAYEAIDVTNDFDTRLMLQEKANAQTVPVLQKGDQFVVGWNPAKLMQLIRE